ncbi:MAG TPA: sulfurtransferase TusA family protein [Spirochaetota bacterium]|nr:sulfurtransferase TusA family protein [Spirochaetota bacterium]
MAEKIDARGLSCPQPVVLTQQAIKKGLTEFQVIVDTGVAKENVLRCVEKNSLSGSAAADGDSFIISVSKK